MTRANKHDALHAAVVAELQRDPTQSNNQIAATTGVHRNTVLRERNALLYPNGKPKPPPGTPRYTVKVRSPNGHDFTRVLVLPEGKKARKERIAEVETLAQTGMNPDQISQRIGVSVAHVRRFANMAGVQFVGARSPGIIPRRVVEQTASSLSGLAQGLAMVLGTPTGLTKEEAQHWADEFQASLRTILRMRDQLKVEAAT